MDNQYIENMVTMALEEDIATGDVSAALIPDTIQAEGYIITREKATLAGKNFAEMSFQKVDKNIKVDWFYDDGDLIQKNNQICKFAGSARSLLTAERTALNFLQMLSGTATYTQQLCRLIQHTKTKLLDTRKTIPGLRLAQKFAVRCGGGVNHRIGLYDAFLLKENHIAATGSIQAAVAAARQLHPDLLLEVEVENLVEFEEALRCQVQRIMLDNFSLKQLQQAVALNAKSTFSAELEASGNVNESTIVAIAETGVDYISVGKLTKDIKSIDLSMRFQKSA